MTVNHKQWLPGLKVPYVVALVAIEEQHDIRLIANIQGVPVENVFIGQEVEVFFEQTADVWVPLFRPSES
ncbi:Zn-ribbon domain-containing OB-fold protein [Parasphingorhabdus sp.]|uniref:Zn-ribbon domain-containing OB-fold protein n=1 Tax=Parasphingorhabdus sp. TaxID=2709688 RepID=UPI0030021043|tara:strand:- start:422 stop:631 length:210 start_codon:yes stop_codon:yes gene_type:complete